MILSLYSRDGEDGASDKLDDKHRKNGEDGTKQCIFDSIFASFYPVYVALTSEDHKCSIYKVGKTYGSSHPLDHGEESPYDICRYIWIVILRAFTTQIETTKLSVVSACFWRRREACVLSLIHI